MYSTHTESPKYHKFNQLTIFRSMYCEVSPRTCSYTRVSTNRYQVVSVFLEISERRSDEDTTVQDNKDLRLQRRVSLSACVRQCVRCDNSSQVVSSWRFPSSVDDVRRDGVSRE